MWHHLETFTGVLGMGGQPEFDIRRARAGEKGRFYDL